MMDRSKPQYITNAGFTRSKKGTGLRKQSGKLPANILSKFNNQQKPFKLSDEAAKQIASVISQMLKSK